MDKIAVLLATYNGQEHLRAMLDSLEVQTHSDFTCYIHDNGSEDDTLEIIDQWVSDHPKKYIRLTYDKTLSAKENFFSLCKGVDADFYLFASQDDFWDPTKIEKLYKKASQIQVHTRIPVLTYSDQYLCDEQLNVKSKSYLKELGLDINRNSLGNVLVENPAMGDAMCVNAALIDKALTSKKCDDIIRYDHWFMLVAASCGIIGVVDEPLVYHREDDEAKVIVEKESLHNKIFNSFKRVATDAVSGELGKEKKSYYASCRKQALELLRVTGISPDARNMLMEFSKLDTENKLDRIEFFRKYGVLKDDELAKEMFWV